MSLRVLVSPSSTIVAGLPPAVRSAHRAVEELQGAQVALGGADESFLRRYRVQLAGTSRISDAPQLTINGGGFPEKGALAAFIEMAQGAPAEWISEGKVVAAHLPGKPARRLELPGWIPAATKEEARAAERRLYAALPKDTDGYIAMLDRRASMAISSVLLNFPVTPNMITAASLLLGLLGSWWLASGDYAWTLAGAALLWFCCLLDGCDGEVARLKLLCSPWGAWFDLAADNVAHFATFAGLAIGVWRGHPVDGLKVSGLLLVTGFLACCFSVWWLVLRKPEEERGPYALLIERVASRDYVYLIFGLAIFGRLDWFIHAAGVGSHLFWIALWLMPKAKPGPKSEARPLPRRDPIPS